MTVDLKALRTAMIEHRHALSLAESQLEPKVHAVLNGQFWEREGLSQIQKEVSIIHREYMTISDQFTDALLSVIDMHSRQIAALEGGDVLRDEIAQEAPGGAASASDDADGVIPPDAPDAITTAHRHTYDDL